MAVLVSVVVPVYNREKQIKAAIDSLLAQDFDGDYEILIVDDGSTDGTKSIVTAIRDPRVKYFHQENSGASAARRRGIVESIGETVCFLDSDDVAKSNYLSLLWEKLNSSSKAILAYGLVADSKGKRLESERLPPTDSEGLLHDPLASLLEYGCFTASMNLMTYREVALFATEGREKVVASNDYDFCLRAARRGPFAFVESVTIQVDRLEDGITASIGHKQAGYAILNACAEVKQSGRDTDLLLLKHLEYRVRSLLPSASVQLFYKGEVFLLLRVLFAGVRYMSLRDLKKFYWALTFHAPKRGG